MKREELIHITLIFNLRQKHYLNEHDHHMVTLYLYTLSLINIWYKKSTKPTDIACICQLMHEGNEINRINHLSIIPLFP
ncbi:hypothetical protein JHK86_042265 [Glycine max]|nr:hypothetical protein JHK86_042265 [Glycine max]